jgi:hypothetical protein
MSFSSAVRPSPKSSANSLLTIQFSSSDEDPSSSAPLFANIEASHSDSDTNSSPFVIPSSDPPPIDFLSFKLVWVSGRLPHSKSEIRFLRFSDQTIYTATHRKIRGHQTYQIFSPGATFADAALEVHKKCKQFNLTVPIVGAKSNLVSETVGISIDVTGVRLLLYSGNTPYIPARKTDRLSAIAFRGETITDGILYRSKMPEFDNNGKPKPFAEIPEIAQKSRKNLVLVDNQGEMVFKMYKISEQTVAISTIQFREPRMAFALGIAMIIA